MLYILLLDQTGDLPSHPLWETSIRIPQNMLQVSVVTTYDGMKILRGTSDSRVQTSRQEMIADLYEMSKVRTHLD